METLLIVLGLAALTWFIVVLVAVLVIRTQLRKRNRVVADAPSPTPLSWLASPGAPARLHRRLRASVAVATATPSAIGGLAAVREDLCRRAMELDRSLATAGRARGPRRRALLRDLAREIDELDELAHRIDRLASRHDRPSAELGEQSEIERLAERLATYEHATDELSAIERQIGGT